MQFLSGTLPVGAAAVDVLLAVCMCSLSLPDSVYPPKSLPIRVDGFPVWDQGPRPGAEGATVLHFVCSHLCCRRLAQGIFPSAYKISYQTMQSILCTLWLQKFLSAEILLIVQVTCQKIS